MKKLFAIVLSLILILTSMTYCAIADSYSSELLEEYNERMTGTWNVISYSGVTSKCTDIYYRLYSGSLRWDIPYPDGGSCFSSDYSDYINYSFYLVGDATGEVYLLCAADNMTTARVYLSSDNNTMMLTTPDGATYVLMKRS